MKMTKELADRLNEIGFEVVDSSLGFSVKRNPFRYVSLSVGVDNDFVVTTSGSRLEFDKANQYLEEMQKLMNVLNEGR